VTAAARVPLCATLLAIALLIACDKGDSQGHTPASVVQDFVEAMGSVHGEPERAKAAYNLLWSHAQENLKERAATASALLGRVVEPEEMIAPSQFSLQFAPKHYLTVLHGDWAEVTVQNGSAQRVVRCINEQGAWKVVVDFPPPRPIERRRDLP
jgi:hypothetical protein